MHREMYFLLKLVTIKISKTRILVIGLISGFFCCISFSYPWTIINIFAIKLIKYNFKKIKLNVFEKKIRKQKIEKSTNLKK